MRKKIVGLLMAVLLCLNSAIYFADSATAAMNFSDIEGSFAKDAILELADTGILNGIGNGNFDPTGKIERQDFAIILAKALELDASSTPATATFSDVPPNHYAYKYVEAAAEAGLIKGVGEGQFGTGQNLSRQDMAVLFVRALGVDAAGKASDLKFRDAGSIADYAKDSVAAAVELGLIKGNSDGTFNPSGNAERQAVAHVASNFLKVAETSKSNQSQPTTPNIPSEIPTPTPSTPSTTGGSSGGSGDSGDRNQTAPSASNVTITGTLEVGSTLTGSYTYIDPEGDPEHKSAFRWCASDDADGTGKVIISGKKELLLTEEHVGKYISFEVTPIATTGDLLSGISAQSEMVGPVKTAPLPPSKNADLSGLKLSSGTLDTMFDSDTANYTASVANSVSSITVTPTAADGKATVTVEGSTVASGNASGDISLNTGNNTITVVVTAEDTTTKTYTVTVTRAKSNNVDLSSLTINEGTLIPAFLVDETNYSTTVANEIANITVTATAADINATVEGKVNGVVTSLSTPISLNVGPNTIEVTVTAEDGTTTKTYTITVNVAQLTVSKLTSDPVMLTTIDAQETLTITAHFNNSTTNDVTSEAEYESDTPSVATVSETGVVTAKTPGTAYITVTYEGETIIVPVYVTAERELDSISASVALYALQLGKTTNLIVNALFIDPQNPSDWTKDIAADVTSLATIEISDENLVKMDANFNLTARQVGTTKIKVTYLSQEYEFELEIYDPNNLK